MGKPESKAQKNAKVRGGRAKKGFRGVSYNDILKKKRLEGVDAYMEREGMISGPSHAEAAPSKDDSIVTDKRMLIDTSPTLGCPGQLAITPNEDHSNCSILDERPTSSVAVCETPKRKRRPNEDPMVETPLKKFRLEDRTNSSVLSDETPSRMLIEDPPNVEGISPRLADTTERARSEEHLNVIVETPRRNFEEDPPAQPAPKLPGNVVLDLEYFVSQIQGDGHSCGFSQMRFVCQKQVRGRSCVTSQFLFECRMCPFKRAYRTQQAQTNLDELLVNGILSAGGGYATAAPIFAAANLPFMSEKRFTAVTEAIAAQVKKTLADSMAKAGAEERRLAIEAGDLLPDGKTPFITVVADGAWSKRSYKTKYNALSGVATIIGYRTGKILFIGMRNKFCGLCCKVAGGARRKHKCYRNWTKASTAMEADIVLEGFKCSLQMHGLVYKRLIGDNDSSVMKRLTTGRPYGAEAVTKVECRNHLFRNLNRHLEALVNATKTYELRDRQELKKNLQRFRKAVRGSIKHWKANADAPSEQAKISGLKRDILNAPKHIFGYHRDCLPHFCHHDKVHVDSCTYNVMSQSAFATDLFRLMNKLANYADSLIKDVDSNRCEQFNSIANKLIGGKRIFYGSRGSYNARMSYAALQFNQGECLDIVARELSGGRTPGSKTKKFADRKRARAVAQGNRLRARRLNMDLGLVPRPSTSQTVNAGKDEHYGATDEIEDEIEDIPESVLEAKKDNHLLELSSADPDEIQSSTMGQGVSQKWKSERSSRLTASNFGRVMSLRPATSTRNTVIQILYTDLSRLPAVKFGVENEPVAKEVFCRKYDKNITDCGLFVDRTYPFLAASPDALVVGEDALLEVKCCWAAHKAGTKSIEEAAEARLLKKYCDMEKNEEDGSVSVSLNTKSHWYYQIQGQLNITGREVGYLFLYTPQWSEAFRVPRDAQLWSDTMVPKLEKFYKRALLPEIVAPLYGREQKKHHIRDSCLR